jgi:hypothetical protein
MSAPTHIGRSALAIAAIAGLTLTLAPAVALGATAGTKGRPTPVTVNAAALASLPDSVRIPAPKILDGSATGFADHGYGVQVYASALPSEETLDAMQPGDTTHNLPLARGTVDARGRFHLRAELGALPRDYVGKAGQVDVVIVAWDGKKQGEVTASTFGSLSDERPLPAVRLVADETQVSQASDSFDKASLDCKETLLSRNHLRNASIGESLTPDYSQTASMTYKGSQSVSLGVAINVSNDTVGFKSSGSVSRTSGFSATWSASANNRSYLLQSELGYYKQTCYNAVSGTYAYTKYSYRAIKLTGGYSTGSASTFSVVSCTSPLAKGTWTRSASNAKAYSNGVGFDISGLAGIDVTSTSNYDTSNALTYTQPTANKYKLCGNNDYPSSAGRIRGYLA